MLLTNEPEVRDGRKKKARYVSVESAGMRYDTQSNQPEVRVTLVRIYVAREVVSGLRPHILAASLRPHTHTHTHTHTQLKKLMEMHPEMVFSKCKFG